MSQLQNVEFQFETKQISSYKFACVSVWRYRKVQRGKKKGRKKEKEHKLDRH